MKGILILAIGALGAWIANSVITLAVTLGVILWPIKLNDTYQYLNPPATLSEQHLGQVQVSNVNLQAQPSRLQSALDVQ